MILAVSRPTHVQSITHDLPSQPRRSAHSRAVSNTLAATRGPTRTPVASSDHIWLQQPNPVIHAALVFCAPLKRRDVVALVNSKVLTMPRFCQRLVTDHGKAFWEMVPSPRADAHVHRFNVDARGGADVMQAAVAALKHRPVNMLLPPWDMSLVHGTDGTCVLLVRVHHAIADGRKLVEAILQCDDDLALLPAAPTPAVALSHRPKRLFGRTRMFVNSACRVVSRGPDPRSTINHRKPATDLGVTWLTTPWPLAQIKHIASAMGGGTVNDVVMTAVAGALRCYMQQRGDDVDALRLRCLLPLDVTRKKNHDSPTSGNAVGAGICKLPIHLNDAPARFAHVHASMQALKHSFEPAMGVQLMHALNHFPRWVRDPLERHGTNSCSLFISNVIGPTRAMRVAGQTLHNLLWFVPPLFNVGLGFPVISYNGNLSVGICADPKLVPDLPRLQALLAEEFVQLGLLA